MVMTRTMGGMFALSALISATAVIGQEYPSKPVRIVTSGAGGSSDLIARMVAEGITGSLGQQVIVDNRPSGVIPGQVVSQAAPDGYTVLLGGNSLWVAPLLQNTPYDVARDFSPITTTSRTPHIVVVHPSLPIKSIKELIALAKAKSGELNYASSGSGGSVHLASELFKSMAGVNIVRIAYKSGSSQMSDLIGGHVQILFGSGNSVVSYVKAGRLRALAISTRGPSVVFPGLPTVAASGLPGYEFVPVDGIFAPAKTPSTAITRLNQEIVRFLNVAQTKERFLNSASEAIGSTPEAFAATIKAEVARMGKLVKDADIRAE